MSGFHVGQRVVCVTPDSGGHLEKGRVYTISAIGAMPSGNIGVALAEAHNGTTPHPWYTWRFRPVRETSIEIFRKLVAPIDGGKVDA